MTATKPRARQATPPPGSLAFPQYWGWALIFAATLLAYLPALSAGFVWNDPDYVTRAGLRSWGGLWRIWFEVGATEQYYPLLHSAFWVQHRLWGDNTTAYHLFNVLLHASCACLLVSTVRAVLSIADCRLPIGEKKSAIGNRQSAMLIPWISGLLFALHPIYVESVAWITEQKNTQSTLFYLAAALLYLRWRTFDEADPAVPPYQKSAESVSGGAAAPARLAEGSRRRVGRDRWARLRWYLAATALFACALLSKSVTASLPAALLVVLWWRRGRLDWKRDVNPLLPWFAMGAAFGLFSAWVEHNYIGANGEDFALTFLDRGVLAGRIIWFYLGKLAWPAELIFIYPRWVVDAGQLSQWIYPLGAIALLAGLWLLRKRTRAPLAAYLFFVGTLFPTGGFFNVFGFTYSYVADHWVYLPSLGPLVLAAAGIAHLLARGSDSSPAREGRDPAPHGAGHLRWGKFALVALLLVLGTLSWRQTRGYRDIETFYRTILAANPDCWMASANLAIIKQEKGEIEEAIALVTDSLRVKSDNGQSMNTLGIALTKAGRRDEALVWYERAVARMPQLVEAHYNLGHLLIELGRGDEGLAHYETALKLRPGYFDARKSLATELLKRGKTAEAATHYNLALKSRWGDADTHFNLGTLLLQEGKLAEAAVRFADVIQIKPDDVAAYANLGDIQARLNRPVDAIACYEAALKIDPGQVLIRAQLGIVLARTGRNEAALLQLREALRREPELPIARLWLANVLSLSGQHAEAVTHYVTFLRAHPDSHEAYNNLGNAYRTLGDTARAIAAYESALRLNPNYTLARENLARLRP